MGNNENLMDYARSLVDNKSIFTRVTNSSTFHSVRSASKAPGSFASKGSAVGLAVAKKAMQLIPIPVLGDLAAEVTGIVERKVRKELHGRNLKNATNAGDKVKFKLKDLSVEEFDRFRWKLQDAVKELQKAQAKFKAAPDGTGDVCSSHLELALAVAQASRRHKRLTELCETMLGTMLEAIDWANDVNVGIKKAEADLVKSFQEQVNYDIEASALPFYDSSLRHGGCSTNYCYFKGVQKLNNSSALKQLAISCASELAELAKPEMYYSLSENPYKAG
ncbi:MAG TPA: hypothetical protein VGM85_04695 [Paraburkholderia sp.]